MTLQMGNKGAFIRFEAPDLKPNIVTFSAVVGVHFYNMVFPVYHLFFFFFFFFFFWIPLRICHSLILQPHPDVKPMAYANNFLQMFQ